MSAHKIHESLADISSREGWALAAVLNSQVVALRYIDDVAPIIAYHLDSDEHAVFFIRKWLGTQEAGKIVRELQELGEVSVGVCSGGEFIAQ